MSGLDSEVQDANMSEPNAPAEAGSSTGPDTRAGDDAGSGRKRKRADSSTDNSGGRKRTKKGPAKKKGYVSPTDWHLKKKDIPADAVGTKNGLEAHLRALWSLLHQNAVPPSVSAADILQFNERFKSEAEVRICVDSYLDKHSQLIHLATARVSELRNELAHLDATKSGTIAASIQRIGETHLLLMFRMVACCGLTRWAPDLTSKYPDSMYNLLHEHIALKTFEQVSLMYGYSHLAVNLANLRNFVLLQKLYRNFVFSYMAGLAKMERKAAGSVAAARDMTNVYKRRDDLKEDRLDVLRSQGFDGVVISLAEETEAHSDDEAVPNEKYYHIKSKTGRSQKVTSFFRLLDQQFKDRQARKGKRYLLTVRERREPPQPQPSRIPTAPKAVPIDYFEPDYWNNELHLDEKIAILEQGVIVALPSIEYCTDWNEIKKWKNLTEGEFMEKYGNQVLEEYQLPSADEIKQHKENIQRGNDDEEEDVADDLLREDEN